MENKINYLFEKAKEIEDDEEFQSHLLNYICVMLSGYIEVNINNIIKQCDKNDNECKSSIKTIQNATWCKIKPILALINIELTLELNNIIIQTNTVDIIYRIISTRNNIVHGKNITNLTLPKLESDFEDIKRFIQKVKELFLGN